MYVFPEGSQRDSDDGYLGNYWIVNQIISKGLHNSDAESMNFTMALVERLEQVMDLPSSTLSTDKL